MYSCCQCKQLCKIILSKVTVHTHPVHVILPQHVFPMTWTIYPPLHSTSNRVKLPSIHRNVLRKGHLVEIHFLTAPMKPVMPYFHFPLPHIHTVFHAHIVQVLVPSECWQFVLLPKSICKL